MNFAMLHPFRITSIVLSFLISLWLAQAASAEPSRADTSLAAGYKAMFTCSAIFNGGKTQDQINQTVPRNMLSWLAGAVR